MLQAGTQDLPVQLAEAVEGQVRLFAMTEVANERLPFSGMNASFNGLKRRACSRQTDSTACAIQTQRHGETKT